MGELVFILGGARSGKSSFALKECLKRPGKRAFIATAEALDDEMRDRIEAHKKQRGPEWESFEEPVELPSLIEKLGKDYDTILTDCLTLWVSNLLLRGVDIPDRSAGLLRAIRAAKGAVFAVSNEVGLGVVPDTRLGRAFRDEAGRLNKLMAGAAEKVFFVAAGIAMEMK